MVKPVCHRLRLFRRPAPIAIACPVRHAHRQSLKELRRQASGYRRSHLISTSAGADVTVISSELFSLDGCTTRQPCMQQWVMSNDSRALPDCPDAGHAMADISTGPRVQPRVASPCQHAGSCWAAGADCNALCSSGRSPLCLAALGRQLKAMQALVRAGAILQASAPDLRLLSNALELAAKCKGKPLLQALVGIGSGC